MTFLHILWALLPLCFIGLYIWSFLRPYFKMHGKEDSKLYLSQGIFCSIGWAVAVLIDRSEWFPGLIESLSWGMLDLSVARWLLYPAVLLAMASVQRFFAKESAPFVPHSKLNRSRTRV